MSAVRFLLVFTILVAGCSEPVDLLEDPGRVTMRRLNRAEYDNTVRNLLGTSLAPSADFPVDDFGNGFDNQGEALSIAPLHLEAWESAAAAVVDDALSVVAEESIWFFEAEGDAVEATSGDVDGDSWNLFANGAVTASVEVDEAGTYRLQARLSGQQAGDEDVRAAFELDGERLPEFPVAEGEGSWGEYTHEVPLAPGEHTIGIAFVNDFYDPDAGLDRNLLVDYVSLRGPLDPEADRAARDRLVPCAGGDGDAGESCARETLAAFLPRAFRRPITDDELEGALELYSLSRASGGDFDEGLGLALRSALLSPHFLFRVEPTPGPGEARLLSPWELASRLSYFLWSSMPDATLFAAAADGSLLEDEVLEAQVRRMLADPRSEALVATFASQWLPVGALDDVAPDPDLFPDWDEALRISMQEQLRLAARDALLADASMLELVTRSEQWIDARLAEHLGVPSPEGWSLSTLDDAPRPGILGSPALLTALSYPERTSPVLRGKWVLSALTCETPPPPPGGVDGLAEGGDGDLSFREQLEQHRADPVCASCHSVMDEVGFSMEGFGPTGLVRSTDHLGLPVDTRGALPGGPRFDHVGELAALLADDPRVPQCMARTTFTFALGRAPRVADIAALDGIEEAFEGGGHRFADLAVAIALSAPFRAVEGEEEP